MHSCIYRGHVRHLRYAPRRHAFRYPLFWLYLDLDESVEAMKKCKLLGSSRFALASFRRDDHLGPGSEPLADTVRRFVNSRTGMEMSGPIRLLTQVRQFGLYFSPLNLFYCFDDQADDVVAVVAEVSNTPWNERHYYLLHEGNRQSETPGRFSHPKQFHVSPFMGMDLFYDWTLQRPRDRLRLSLASRRGDQRCFHAKMDLQRRELNDVQLARVLLRFPLSPVQTLGAIYWQAFRLWIKRCRFFPHPHKTKVGSSRQIA